MPPEECTTSSISTEFWHCTQLRRCGLIQCHLTSWGFNLAALFSSQEQKAVVLSHRNAKCISSYLLTVKGKCSPLLLTLLDSTSLFYSQSDSLKANREQALLANFFVYPLYQPPTPSPSRHLDSVCQPLSLNMQQREALHSTFLCHS